MEMIQLLALVALWSPASACSGKSTSAPARISKLEVITFSKLFSPMFDFDSSNIEHTDALFGRPKYSSAIAEKLIKVNSTLCDSDTPESVTKDNSWPKMDFLWPIHGNFILMTERGGCIFTEKARNAQKLGAVALIIGNNKCKCGERGCTAGACDVTLPSMIPPPWEDVSDLTIPTMMVAKHVCDLFHRVLMKGLPVNVRMSWSMPIVSQSTQRVNMTAQPMGVL